MLDKLIDILKEDEEIWATFKEICIEKEIASKTVLLKEGEISNNLYFIKKGCLREWFNKDGKDITFQFFFEREPVASIDSFIHHKPSLFTIESIEPSIILSIRKADFDELITLYPEFKTVFHNFILTRFGVYGQLFLSRIKDSPQERYEELMKNQPEILKRIPQHYIASYLGVTPISLSRIRNRKPH